MGFGDVSKKDKKAASNAAAAAAAAAAEEDAAWAEGGKKANKKKEAEDAKKEAKAARKQEADDQLKAEEAEMSTPRGGKKKDKGGGAKLTRAEIAAKAMAAAKAKEKEEKQKKFDIEKSGGNEYIGVLTTNDNRAEGIDASGVDAAIDALSLGESSGGGGKKVNLKAAYLAFEEREIFRLKQENPGLKLSQYKERAHQAWQKSPENPANQAVDVS